ncbi:MAG: ABC transporter substrate-binding protein [Christensenellales bacterium]|jgi:multiple sugar transport system substrate-binding protein
MKKLLCFVLCLAMMPFVFSASAENISINFSIWDKNQQPGMEAIAAAYTEKNPDVTINVQVTPWSEYWTKLQAAAAGGSLPDVFWMHSNQFYVYAEAGTMLDLTDLNIDYSPYPEGITAMYQYEGGQYAVPKDYDTIALAYNKEIFDNAGVAYPDDTWTWDTLLENAKKLTDKEKGIYGYGAPIHDQQGFLNFIYQNEGYEFKDGKSGYDLPETREALQFYIDFALKHEVSPTPQSFADVSADDQFKAGRLAMLNVGTWMMSDYTVYDGIKDKFDLAVLPKGKVRASIYNGLGYAGAATTEHPEQVKDFIKFCGSEEANIIQAKHKAAIPAYAGTEKYFVEQFPNINIGAYPEMISYGVPFPFSQRKSLWINTEYENLGAVYSGEFTLEEACDRMHQTITEVEAE